MLARRAPRIAKTVRGIIRHLWRTAFSTIAPNRYARSIGVHLGDRVHFYGLKPNMFGSEPWLVRIGDDVHITSGCQFVTHDGGTLILRHLEPSLEITAPISIGDRVYLGMDTKILPGVTVGSDVVIGTGSIVTRDIPAGSVAAGVPARFIRPLDEYFESLKSRSLRLGHLSAREKEIELRRYFRSFIAGR